MVGVARTSTARPSRSVNDSPCALCLKNTQRTCADASLSVKYECPEAARVNPETSPLTHSRPRWRSSNRRAEETSSDTGTTVEPPTDSPVAAESGPPPGLRGASTAMGPTLGALVECLRHYFLNVAIVHDKRVHDPCHRPVIDRRRCGRANSDRCSKRCGRQ